MSEPWESEINFKDWTAFWNSQKPVTREEYEGLFNAIVRLTDRIEALEKQPWPIGSWLCG